MLETVLVTGSTGLIGAALVRRLAASGVRVLATARDEAKARRLFAGLAGVSVVEWNVLRPAPASIGSVDGIVHAASETSSKAFVERPVETIETILTGTRHVLELARLSGVSSVACLSTMEVYGSPTVDPVGESDYGYLDPVAVRSSYPEAKRLAESLCAAYRAEYGVPVKIARLTQTFGEGVRYEDGRVFAEFARAILERRDIVLKTAGSTARCYCYLGDAVEAIRVILERGADGEAYTVANESTFCTIREMAERLAAAHPEAGSKVVVDPAGAESRGFAPPFRMRLNCAKLRSLGWEPKVGLIEAFDRMMAAMRPLRTGGNLAKGEP